MNHLIATFLLLLVSTSLAATEYFWSGAIGEARIKLIIEGPAYPENYNPASDEDTKFYTLHKKSVRGFYQYDKFRSPLSLIGSTQDGAWKLEEHNGSICTNCKPNGYFDGHQNGDSVSGFWTSADSSKKIPFRLTREPLLKKTILGWLRGAEWVLDGAEGFYGANTMTSLGKDQKGRWGAGGSSISGGMREPYDAKVSREENKILNGLRILVTDSLDLVVKAGIQEILRIPYQEDPYFVLEKITKDTDGIGRIHEYQGKPALTISSVNLATTDKGLFDDILQIEALPFDTPTAAHIEYIIPGDGFRITLISADCCATQDLSFVRVSPTPKSKGKR